MDPFELECLRSATEDNRYRNRFSFHSAFEFSVMITEVYINVIGSISAITYAGMIVAGAAQKRTLRPRVFVRAPEVSVKGSLFVRR